MNLYLTKKGIIYRSAILGWAVSEHLQQLCVLFDNHVAKFYRLPSFEQTSHLQCDVAEESSQAVHVSSYQEFIFFNSEKKVAIIDMVRQEMIAKIKLSFELSVKLLPGELAVKPLLMAEQIHLVLANCFGTVLMVTFDASSLRSKGQTKEVTLKSHDCSLLRLSTSQADVVQKKTKVHGRYLKELSCELVFDSQNVPRLLTAWSGNFGVS